MDCERVYRKAAQIKDRYIELRHDLHIHPELSMKEERTSALVANRLRELGIEVETGFGCATSVIGTLRGGKPGKIVGLRADMDALPVEEANDWSFRSQNPGVMHACGHDVHTSSLLGAAEILSSFRDELPGTVKFYFEPGEENGGGGMQMIKAGCLQKDTPNAVFASHVTPNLPVGTVVFSKAAASAYCDGVRFEIKGKQSHGSEPQNGIDAVGMAAHLWLAVQSAMTRRLDPVHPATIGIGVMKAGTAHNITAGEAVLEGTLRNLDPGTRLVSIKALEDTAAGVGKMFGGSCEFQLLEGYPAVINNAELADFIRPTLREITALYAPDMPEGGAIDGEMVIPMKRPFLGGEDFGYFAEAVPSFFYFIGAGLEGGGLHTPNAKPLDDTVFANMSVLAALTLRALED